MRDVLREVTSEKLHVCRQPPKSVAQKGFREEVPSTNRRYFHDRRPSGLRHMRL